MAAAAGDSPALSKFVVKWSKEQTEKFIRLRAEHEQLFTGAKNTAVTGYTQIVDMMGLGGKVTPEQAKRKWDNLKSKYKDCKSPSSGQGTEDGKPTAGTWPWFTIMDEMLGQKPSVTPPVLIASIPDSTPGPSTSSQTPSPPSQAPVRKREREQEKGRDEVIDLIREDLLFQREVEERRQQESRERADRFFGLLERLVERQAKQ